MSYKNALRKYVHIILTIYRVQAKVRMDSKKARTDKGRTMEKLSTYSKTPIRYNMSDFNSSESNF